MQIIALTKRGRGAGPLRDGVQESAGRIEFDLKLISFALQLQMLAVKVLDQRQRGSLLGRK